MPAHLPRIAVLLDRLPVSVHLLRKVTRAFVHGNAPPVFQDRPSRAVAPVHTLLLAAGGILVGAGGRARGPAFAVLSAVLARQGCERDVGFALVGWLY